MANNVLYSVGRRPTDGVQHAAARPTVRTDAGRTLRAALVYVSGSTTRVSAVPSSRTAWCTSPPRHALCLRRSGHRRGSRVHRRPVRPWISRRTVTAIPSPSPTASCTRSRSANSRPSTPRGSDLTGFAEDVHAVVDASAGPDVQRQLWTDRATVDRRRPRLRRRQLLLLRRDVEHGGARVRRGRRAGLRRDIPKTCDPIATAGTSSSGLSLYKGPPASVNHVVYAGDGVIQALDAAGLAPLWRSSNGTLSSATIRERRRVRARRRSSRCRARSRCTRSRTTPPGSRAAAGRRRRRALWSGPVGPAQDLFAAISSRWVGPTVANGTVYVRTDRLRAYTLP